MVLEGLGNFNLVDLVNYLVTSGVYDILLPFLLIFSIVFAMLEKIKIFGDKRNINMIVSAVIGLLLIVQQGIVQTINLFLPRVSLIIVVILMAVLVMSLLAGKEYKGLNGTFLGVATIIAIIAVLIALVTPPSGYGGSWLTAYDQQVLLSIGLPLLVLFGVIALVTAKPGQPGQPGATKKFVDVFREALKD